MLQFQQHTWYIATADQDSYCVCQQNMHVALLCNKSHSSGMHRQTCALLSVCACVLKFCKFFSYWCESDDESRKLHCSAKLSQLPGSVRIIESVYARCVSRHVRVSYASGQCCTHMQQMSCAVTSKDGERLLHGSLLYDIDITVGSSFGSHSCCLRPEDLLLGQTLKHGPRVTAHRSRATASEQ